MSSRKLDKFDTHLAKIWSLSSSKKKTKKISLGLFLLLSFVCFDFSLVKFGIQSKSKTLSRQGEVGAVPSVITAQAQLRGFLCDCCKCFLSIAYYHSNRGKCKRRCASKHTPGRRLLGC